MAYIPGHIKDEVVVVGNHRDGIFHLFFSRGLFLTKVQLGYADSTRPMKGTVDLIYIGYGSWGSYIWNRFLE